MFDAAIYAILHRALSVSHPMFGFLLFNFGYQQAGGARDDHWTGTNEDASDSSVISRGDALLTYLPI